MSSEVDPLCISEESFTTTVINFFNGKVFKNKEDAINDIIELYNDSKKMANLKRQAKTSAERCGTKYFAESALDVYQRAIQEKKNNKPIFSKIIDKIKGDK